MKQRRLRAIHLVILKVRVNYIGSNRKKLNIAKNLTMNLRRLRAITLQGAIG